jgi:hypothetical protein
MSTFDQNRVFPVVYTGFENDGTTVIAADLPAGGCVCTVENTGAVDTETSLQEVTRPATANLNRAKKYIVAPGQNLTDINRIVDTATGRRKGGVVFVHDPNHCANAEVRALVTGSVAVGDTLIAVNAQFHLAVATRDAAMIVGAPVAVAREVNASGTNLRTVSPRGQ